jgi:hypothetical protein
VPVNAENTFLLFKEQSPFKLKQEYPSEQWQIIGFRLIPLKTPVSFRWTVPLKSVLWIFYRRYSPKIDAVRNTDETKVAIANSK